MTVAVTGAAGHVGTNLVAALTAAGQQVRVIDRREPPAPPSDGVDWVVADVRDQAAMTVALQDIDVVYHLAAVISVAGPMSGLVDSVNIDGVRATARAALTSGVRRFVQCSSVHAYDLMACRGAVVNEDSPRSLDPRVPAYDRSKAAGEVVLRQVVDDGLNAVIINPTGVVGPLDPEPSRMGVVLRAIAAGRLPATIRGSFDWVDVRDVVAALIAASELGAVGENYLIGGDSATVAEIADLAAGVTDARRPAVELPMWLARLFTPVGDAVARRYPHPMLYTTDTLNALASEPDIDHSKATTVLGHEPRPLARTVTELVHSLRAA